MKPVVTLEDGTRAAEASRLKNSVHTAPSARSSANENPLHLSRKLRTAGNLSNGGWRGCLWRKDPASMKAGSLLHPEPCVLCTELCSDRVLDSSEPYLRGKSAFLDTRRLSRTVETIQNHAQQLTQGKILAAILANYKRYQPDCKIVVCTAGLADDSHEVLGYLGTTGGRRQVSSTWRLQQLLDNGVHRCLAFPYWTARHWTSARTYRTAMLQGTDRRMRALLMVVLQGTDRRLGALRTAMLQGTDRRMRALRTAMLQGTDRHVRALRHRHLNRFLLAEKRRFQETSLSIGPSPGRFQEASLSPGRFQEASLSPGKFQETSLTEQEPPPKYEDVILT
ncbi:hypothetical protein Bbelb_108580 [Branchiostoma belcheri]|nr:hypothetical protein Bbelb_108580 [Branchiostoma belcheri]